MDCSKLTLSIKSELKFKTARLLEVFRMYMLIYFFVHFTVNYNAYRLKKDYY